MKVYIKRFFTFLIIFSILFGCSTAEEDEEAPIQLISISAIPVSGRGPSETADQQDMELFLKVSEKNLQQDIIYNWYVEEIPLDIDSYKDGIDVSSDEDVTKMSNYSNFFLEKSKSPLNVMLSIYKPGYYKISVVASNLIETKQKSIIIKVGSPDFPTLRYSFNFPKNDLTSDDFVGGFIVKYTGSVNNENNGEQKFIEAKDIGSTWFDTGVAFNPLTSFSITTGTHVVEYNKEKHIVSLGKNNLLAGVDGFYYDTNKSKNLDVLLSPVLLKNIQSDFIFKLYKKGSSSWADGSIFVSSLMWGVDEYENPLFECVEKTLSKDKTEVEIPVNNKFLAKVFIGSMGHKVPNNEYKVYFSPDGIDSNEYDLKKERPFQGLPYGHLVGKLGENGKVFPVGVKYVYSNTQNAPIFGYDIVSKTYRQLSFGK